MRMPILVAFVSAAVTFADQQRGAVSSVRVSAPQSGVVAVTVSGTNPCGAVNIDYGDGAAITHPISRLPMTVRHEYTQAGEYQVRARGMGNCDGVAAASVRLNAPAGAQKPGGTRFPGMDRNGDGVITRQEWRGSAQSFRVHDWNGDGVLSGDEVRTAARRRLEDDPNYAPGRNVLDDWSERRFKQLDHNNDNRISRDEWHYDSEAFVRADRNRDGVLSRAEFLDTAIDDDRSDQFDDLDLNGDGRIQLNEWHGSRDVFDWLDRNNDRILTRAEVAGQDLSAGDEFSSLDMNRDQSLSRAEWHWSSASFDRLDANGDGRLSRREFEAGGPLNQSGTSSTPLIVPAEDRWTDTGIVVRAGDRLTFDANGTIQMSEDGSDVADPPGARSGRRAADAPLANAPAGALIGRIGNGAPFLIGGNSGPIAAPRAGRLYFGVNDDHLADNNGEYRVTVTVRR